MPSHIHILPEEADPAVTSHAKQRAHLARYVVLVIHDQASCLAANLAFAILRLQHTLIVFERYAVAGHEHAVMHFVAVVRLPAPIARKVFVVIGRAPGAELLFGDVW